MRSAWGIGLISLTACGPAPVKRTANVHWHRPDAMPQLSASRSDTLLAPCGIVLPVISGEGIGALHLGMSPDSVQAACPAALIGYSWGDEALPVPATLARLGGAVVVAEFSDTTPDARLLRLEASDGLIPGIDGSLAAMQLSTLSEFLGPATLVEGECVLFASWPSHPHLAVRLALHGGTTSECGKLADDSAAVSQAQVETIIVARPDAA